MSHVHRIHGAWARATGPAGAGGAAQPGGGRLLPDRRSAVSCRHPALHRRAADAVPRCAIRCAAPPAVQPRWGRPPVARLSALQPPSCPSRPHLVIPRRRAFEAFDSFGVVGVEPNADTYAALMQASLRKVARRFRCVACTTTWAHGRASASALAHARLCPGLSPSTALLLLLLHVPPQSDVLPCCCHPCAGLHRERARRHRAAGARAAGGGGRGGHRVDAPPAGGRPRGIGWADQIKGRWRMDGCGCGCVGVLEAVSSAALKAGVPCGQVFQHAKKSA